MNLNADWIWVGFIPAGHETAAKSGEEEWEQLPAYAPPDEEASQLENPAAEGCARDAEEEEDWVIEPPRGEPGVYIGGVRVGVVELPGYR
jgi:hypothetical protein